MCRKLTYSHSLLLMLGLVLTITAKNADAYIDPTTPTTLGFSEDQFGITATNGIITATNDPGVYALSDTAEFIVRVGNSDAVIIEVTPSMTSGNTTPTQLAADVDQALTNAGLGDVIDADSSGGKVRLSVVSYNLTALGFASNELILDGVKLTAGSAPTLSTEIKFVLSVDHGAPVLISVPGGTATDTVTKLVNELNIALSGTGVTASDDGGKINLDPGSQYIQVSNDLTFAPLTPTIDAGVDQTEDEGVTVSLGATFIDWYLGGTHSAEIDWGDGGLTELGVVDQDLHSVSGSHAYDENGVYTVTVTVTDDSTYAEGSDTLTVTVDNVAPTAILGNDGPKVEGSVVTVTFSNQYDPGASDTFTYSFDWDNDGTYDIVDQASPSAQHTWYDEGVYTVRAKIKDDDEGYNEYTTDVQVVLVNCPPDCSNAAPSLATLWPPNGKFVPITITGVTDPDGDFVTITIDSIFQDEPVNGEGSGNTAPDGKGVGTDTAEVRAERCGTKKVPGNGRVYHIGFSADDGNGGTCTGTVTVCVPHDKSGDECVDDGPFYDSTSP